MRICLTVIAGFQASSSFRMDKQTVPLGYTFGWNRGGTNLPVQLVRPSYSPRAHASAMFGLHFGGFVGYSGQADEPSVSTVNFRYYWFGQFTVRELHGQLELATLPNGLLLARYTTLPVLEV